MIPVAEAQQRILRATRPLPSETVALEHAADRVLSSAPLAVYPLPAFDNSAMDGYAVRSENLTGAAESNPARLQVLGTIPAGQCWKEPLPSGATLRIFTGSPLPPGADAVVMQEEVRKIPGSNAAEFSEPVKPWDNIRFRGEEIKAGTPLLEAGRRLNFSALGLLRAAGVQRVEVTRRPRVALVATGNELVENATDLPEGKIVESNRFLLASLVARFGGEVVSSFLAEDSPEVIQAALSQTGADLVLSCGGVSVGEFDFVQAAFEKSGGRIDFWKVAIRPGKPFLFGRRGEELFFGLPGNPVSAAVSFLILVLPALQQLQGEKPVGLPSGLGRLSAPLSNRSNREHFVAVQLREGAVAPAGRQASHLMGTLAQANGLVGVPPETEWPAGSEVRVRLLPD